MPQIFMVVDNWVRLDIEQDLASELNAIDGEGVLTRVLPRYWDDWWNHMPVTTESVSWYQRFVSGDYRGVLDYATQVCLLCSPFTRPS
jgi:hypothetical protein